MNEFDILSQIHTGYNIEKVGEHLPLHGVQHIALNGITWKIDFEALVNI